MRKLQRYRCFLSLLPCLFLPSLVNGNTGIRRTPAVRREGPILTLTLRDLTSSSAATGAPPEHGGLVRQLQPSALYAIRSRPNPFPNWFPSLRSLQAALGCQLFKGQKRTNPPATCCIEATAKWDRGPWQLQIQPSHSFLEDNRQETQLLVQLARGAHYMFARAVRSSAGQHGRFRLQELKTSWLWTHNIPFASSISSIRLTPILDFVTSASRPQLRGHMEAVTGPRTKCWLYWGAGGNDTTGTAKLALQYAPDDHHLLRPEIDLVTGTVVYHWIATVQASDNNNAVPSSVLHVRVDPQTAVEMTWMEYYDGSGHWTVEARLPLLKEQRPQIRVKRQFRF